MMMRSRGMMGKMIRKSKRGSLFIPTASPFPTALSKGSKGSKGGKGGSDGGKISRSKGSKGSRRFNIPTASPSPDFANGSMKGFGMDFKNKQVMKGRDGLDFGGMGRKRMMVKQGNMTLMKASKKAILPTASPSIVAGPTVPVVPVITPRPTPGLTESPTSSPVPTVSPFPTPTDNRIAPRDNTLPIQNVGVKGGKESRISSNQYDPPGIDEWNAFLSAYYSNVFNRAMNKADGRQSYIVGNDSDRLPSLSAARKNDKDKNMMDSRGGNAAPTSYQRYSYMQKMRRVGIVSMADFDEYLAFSTGDRRSRIRGEGRGR
jgi:hypothetical protein